tara:strand:+ start:288 stop:1406 length:1119 start_codon:yes stop_codon:yes gene_type:complete
MTPRQREIYEVVKRLGSKTAAAKELQIDKAYVRRAYALAEAWLNSDQGIVEALENTGLSAETGKHGWRRVQNKETGSWDSVFWKSPNHQDDLIPWAELFKEALGSIPQPLHAPTPDNVSYDLLPRYLIADVHFGMRAWKVETGNEYSIEIAAQRMSEASAMLINAAPYTDRAIILNLGDTLHQNDSKNMTPTSGHILDVDGRFAQAAMAAVKSHVAMIEAAKAKHKHIEVVVLAGNHDPDFTHMLAIALVMRYEEDERVTVHWNPSKLWVFEFGRNMLAAHHGDKTKPDRLAMLVADVHAPMWGRTYWRYLDTGHIHQDSSKDIGGIFWESHRAITTRDAAAAGFGYTGRSTMKCVTVHRERGEVMRYTAGI